MDQNTSWTIHPDDVHILRGLLKRKHEIAQDPIMAQRCALWTRHAALDSEPVPRRRPMILAETMGVLDELVPLSTLQCQEGWARDMERQLRDLLFRYEHVGDDFVVEPWIPCPWDITIGDFGVQTRFVRADNEGKLGSYTWDPPIVDLDKDFDKLHFRTLTVDRERTLAWISTAHFDEDAIRQDLETTLRIAGHCPLKLVMKDVHTLADQPWRLGRWVEIARQVCAAFGYA